MSEGQPGRLPPEVIALERIQTEIDAAKAPRTDGARLSVGAALHYGGQGLEHGIAQPATRSTVLRDPHSERGPQGL